MASEDDKTPPKPFPWWTVLVSILGLLLIVGLVILYRRRRAAMSINTGAMAAVPGPNVAPPPGVMARVANSTAAPVGANASGRV